VRKVFETYFARQEIGEIIEEVEKAREKGWEEEEA
jgi:hypothetical protein